MIEKGLWKPEYETKVKRETVLGTGLIMAGIGIALLTGSSWVVWAAGQWLKLGGLIVLLVEAALTVYYHILKRETA